jgi:hypothetical protein
MTYYKYAERTADQFINWREIGKSISDTIQEQSKIREEKKATLDKEFRETMKAVVDSPQGSDNEVNSWTLNVTNNAAEYLRTINNELKAGRMSPKDFTIARQNVTDDVNGLFTQIKSYQEWHKGRLAQIQSGKASGFDKALNEQVEKIADLKNTSGYFDPMTGNLFFSKTDESGKPDRSSLLSAKNMFKISGTQVDRYDLNSELVKMGKTFAPYKRVIGRSGVQTKDDVTLRKGFDEVKSNTFGAILDNPYTAASVLTDNGLDGYTYTTGEPKSDKEIKIVQTPNGYQPQITDSQRKAAMDFMERQLSVYLPYEETPMPKATDTRASDSEDKMTDNEKAALGTIKSLYSGTPAQKKVAADRLAKKLGVTKIDYTNEGIIATKQVVEGGKTKTIKTTYPYGNSLSEFASSGLADVLGAGGLLARPELEMGAKRSSGTGSVSGAKVMVSPPSTDQHDQIITKINESLEDAFDTKDGETLSKGVDAYKSAIRKMGLDYNVVKVSGNPALRKFVDQKSGVFVVINVEEGKGNIGEQYAEAFKALNEKVQQKINE